MGQNSSKNVTIRSGDTGLSAEQIPEKTDLLLVLKLKASLVTEVQKLSTAASDKTSPEAVCACDSRNVAIRESFRLLSRQYQILSFLLIPYPGREGRHCPREINISLRNTVPISGFFFHEAGITLRSQVPAQCGSQ